MEHSVLHDELSTGQWTSLFEDFSTWKPYLYFSGGEPLLRKDLPAIIKFATDRMLLTALNSNTTLLTEELAERLVRSGLDYYIASLDGPEAINNRIRKGRDVYNRVIAGIRSLVQAKAKLKSALPIIEVCTTVTTENQHHLLETAQLVDQLGVDYFKLQLGVFTNPDLLARTEARFTQSFGVPPKLWAGYVRDMSGIDTEAVAQQEQAIRARRWSFAAGRYPKRSVQGFEFESYFKTPDKVFGEKLCHVPWKRAVIRPNGDVVGCPLFPEARLGNIKEQKFAEIWNGFQMRNFRQSLTQEGLFPTCARCCELYELDESKG
jgi:radical SAM protein with 4Fe4S-binding SPASM domain